MLTDPEVVGKNHIRDLLEPECFELLLVLAVRVYDVDRFRTGSCSSGCILEAADEAIYEDRAMRSDEHDYAFSDCHYH